MSTQLRTSAPALPATVRDLIEQRKVKFERTLNDYVEDVHLQLWENTSYQKLLTAVWPEEAVEGSLIADDLEAARMIRDYAREHGVHFLLDKKLATIRKSLAVVLRRYQQSRVERRRLVDGQFVSGNGGDDHE